MFSELVAKCRELKIEQERCKEDDYFEFVIPTVDIDKFKEIISSVLGPAVKRQGDNPSEDLIGLVRNYGGLKKDQVLYKKEIVDSILIAILWSWDNGKYTTLKFAKIPKK